MLMSLLLWMVTPLVWLGLALLCLLLQDLFLFVLKRITLNSHFPPIFAIHANTLNALDLCKQFCT